MERDRAKAPSYIISSAKNLKILSTLFRSRSNHLPYNCRPISGQPLPEGFSFFRSPIVVFVIKSIVSLQIITLAIKGFNSHEVLQSLLQPGVIELCCLVQSGSEDSSK